MNDSSTSSSNPLHYEIHSEHRSFLQVDIFTKIIYPRLIRLLRGIILFPYLNDFINIRNDSKDYNLNNIEKHITLPYNQNDKEDLQEFNILIYTHNENSIKQLQYVPIQFDESKYHHIVIQLSTNMKQFCTFIYTRLHNNTDEKYYITSFMKVYIAQRIV